MWLGIKHIDPFKQIHRHVKESMKIQIKDYYTFDNSVGRAWNRVQVMVSIIEYLIFKRKKITCFPPSYREDAAQLMAHGITDTATGGTRGTPELRISRRAMCMCPRHAVC